MSAPRRIINSLKQLDTLTVAHFTAQNFNADGTPKKSVFSVPSEQIFPNEAIRLGIEQHGKTSFGNGFTLDQYKTVGSANSEEKITELFIYLTQTCKLNVYYTALQKVDDKLRGYHFQVFDAVELLTLMKQDYALVQEERAALYPDLANKESQISPNIY